MNKIEIKGKNRTGKNILVMSGIHGNELTPIYCTYLLSETKYNLEDFENLTIVSAINFYGICENTRNIPQNNTDDLNRMFSIKLNIDLKKEIEKLIDENDVIIDIHSSPNCDEFLLLNQDETTNSYVDFCIENDLHYLIRYSNTNTIKKYCIDLDKLSFTLELNKMDYIDYNSAKNGSEIIKKIISSVNNFKINKSEPKYKDYIEFKTHKTGLLLPKIQNGEIIKNGEIIGEILNLNTFEKSEVQNNLIGDYRVICFGSSNYVDPDNSVCLLQPL